MGWESSDEWRTWSDVARAMEVYGPSIAWLAWTGGQFGPAGQGQWERWGVERRSDGTRGVVVALLERTARGQWFLRDTMGEEEWPYYRPPAAVLRAAQPAPTTARSAEWRAWVEGVTRD